MDRTDRVAVVVRRHGVRFEPDIPAMASDAGLCRRGLPIHFIQQPRREIALARHIGLLVVSLRSIDQRIDLREISMLGNLLDRFE